MPRHERRVENQKLFREINERIAELHVQLGDLDSPFTIMCECSQVECAQMTVVPLDIYRRVHDDARLHVVVRGHQDQAHERTVEDHGEFLIVRALEGDPS